MEKENKSEEEMRNALNIEKDYKDKASHIFAELEIIPIRNKSLRLIGNFNTVRKFKRKSVNSIKLLNPALNEKETPIKKHQCAYSDIRTDENSTNISEIAAEDEPTNKNMNNIDENNIQSPAKGFKEKSVHEKLLYLTTLPYYLNKVTVEVKTRKRFFVGYILEYSCEEHYVSIANMNTYSHHIVKIDEILDINLLSL